MAAPQKIIDLVERFERNKEAYMAGQYNETQVRREFIDPFFKELGWDIDNEQGYAEAYKDVVHEDAIRIGGMHKAPDYCMRIGGARKFFVEAKKPSVNVKDDTDPAFQVRRYAWSAKLALSILTDFQELAVYDCRIKPVKNDKSTRARIAYFTFKDYIEKWDEIAAIFSRDAVLKGSFDKYAEKAKQKKGSEEVDEAFLKEIEKWRELLAKNIALRNTDLSQRELNYAVQVTIDRLVFLRICEDRGIEQYGQLLAEVNGINIYGKLKKHFRDADDRYNSGLFHFETEKDQSEAPDSLTLDLIIDDAPLKEIVSHLYYPESPYEFSVLSADILGQVYEQFLGKVIRLTEGHQAKIEEKPEVRKAGGVYYTPVYIVKYIVENTIGKFVEGKTPKEVAKLTICDPACGSGSFLLGAYQFLLDWHLQYYMGHDPKKWNKQLTQGIKGDWRLTTGERKRILLSNIYGVDIDAQAVEVTKLSLLLKVLEGETGQSLQTTFINERVLPNLGGNIKCGNSLIGTEFYLGNQLNLLDTEEQMRINVFDWEKAFPQVFAKKSAFDIIIGNPPWGASFNDEERSYLIGRFPAVPSKTKDSYFFFIIRSLLLLRGGGFLGFIVPNTWLLINNAADFRRQLLKLDIKEISDHGDGVFPDATVESATFILRNQKNEKGSCRAQRISDRAVLVDHIVDKTAWLQDEDCRIIVDLNEEIIKFLKKIDEKAEKFEDRCAIIWGIKPYQVGHGDPPQTNEMMENRIYHSATKKGDDWKPLLVGKNVNRYSIHFPENQYIRYGKWLMYPSNEKWMIEPKILLRQTSDVLRACFDDKSYYCQNSVFIIRSEEINLRFLTALLNSKLLNFIYKIHNPQTGKAFAEIKPSVIKKLPICKIENKNQKEVHNKLVDLADRMFLLHSQMTISKTPHEQDTIKRQIEMAYGQIDQLVFQLYEITGDEIEMIEASFNKQ